MSFKRRLKGKAPPEACSRFDAKSAALTLHALALCCRRRLSACTRLTAARLVRWQGWELIEKVIDDYESQMRDAVNEDHEGKRKNENTWRIHRIHFEKNRFIFDLMYKRQAMSKELVRTLMFACYCGPLKPGVPTSRKKKKNELYDTTRSHAPRRAVRVPGAGKDSRWRTHSEVEKAGLREPVLNAGNSEGGSQLRRAPAQSPRSKFTWSWFMP